LPPYLSIVAASRNDNHGGDLLKRMQIFVTGVLEQCRRHDLSAELILVEWNPPGDRPGLAEALRWPEPGPCAVRLIEVPAAIHRRFAHADALPLHQMIAKNVGIRRARGEFVLATNIDLLFSDELMRFLASRALEKDRMYRIDRSDVAADVPDAPVEEQLAWCAHHMIRIHAAAGMSTVTPGGGFQFEDADIAANGSGIKLGAGWFAREKHGRRPFRWFDNDAEIFVEGGKRHLQIDIAAGPGVRSGSAMLGLERVGARRIVNIPLSGKPERIQLHIDRGGDKREGEPRALNMCVRGLNLSDSPTRDGIARAYWALRRAVGRMIYPAPRYADPAPDFLHLAACGDFTLLARDRWCALRGYPEMETFPMNVDSVLCWAAHYGGAKECVLAAPMRAYHIEHQNSASGSEHAQFFAGLREKGVPWLDQSEMLRWGFEMARAGAPKIFNGEDWGLAQEQLQETTR
jgi:hypothetical protein